MIPKWHLKPFVGTYYINPAINNLLWFGLKEDRTISGTFGKIRLELGSFYHFLCLSERSVLFMIIIMKVNIYMM